MQKKHLALIRIIAAALLAGMLVYTLIVQVPKGTNRIPTSQMNAIDFDATLLDGKTVRLSSLRGQIVILFFWNTACPACKQLFPLLIEYHKSNPQSALKIFAIAAEDADTLKQFVANYELELPVIADQNAAIHSLYQVQALPHTVFIDGNGIIRAAYVGAISRQWLMNTIKSLNSSVPQQF